MRPAPVLALIVLLASAGCDRAPSASGLPEWTPADHEAPRGRAGQGGQAGPSGPSGPDEQEAPAQGAKAEGGGPSLVEVAWRQQCATCHGATGRGDGPQSAMFRPPNLAQSRATDTEIAAVIRNGRGKMPRFDLPDDVVNGLVVHVRSLRDP